MSTPIKITEEEVKEIEEAGLINCAYFAILIRHSSYKISRKEKKDLREKISADLSKKCFDKLKSEGKDIEESKKKAINNWISFFSRIAVSPIFRGRALARKEPVVVIVHNSVYYDTENGLVQINNVGANETLDNLEPLKDWGYDTKNLWFEKDPNGNFTIASDMEQPLMDYFQKQNEKESSFVYNSNGAVKVKEQKTN